jgi:hydrogenase small subunit
MATETFYDVMRRQGITRRSFTKFCSLTAAALGLPPAYAAEIQNAMETKPRIPVLWMHGLECTCCSESFIRSGHPLAKDVILSMISLDYDDTLMAAAGHQAEAIVKETIEKYDGNFILAVEGNPPLNQEGMSCIIGGRPFLEQLKEAADHCKAIISWGSCASWGCVQAARPNPTQATPIHKVPGLPAKPIIKVPGCPPIAEVMTAVIAYILTFERFPELDLQGRPKMFYSQRIHDKCYRRPHFDAGQFVEHFDDEARARAIASTRSAARADDLQRLLDGALERWSLVPDPGRAPVHRLLGRRLLGQGLVLQPPRNRLGLRHRGQCRHHRCRGGRYGGSGHGRPCRRHGGQARARKRCGPQHDASRRR